MRTDRPVRRSCGLTATPAFRVTAVSGARDLLDWNEDDLVGRSLYEFVHPSDLSEMRRAHEDLLRSPIRGTHRYRIRERHGAFVWIETDCSSVVDATGRVTGFEAEWRRLDDVPQFRCLREAIEADQLVLHYQPIVHIESGAPVQFEALVRWQRSDRLVPPAEFIPFAMVSGLIRPLTEWVIATALCDQRRIAESGIHAPIAVNVSLRDLIDPLFAVTLIGGLVGAGAGPEDLILEITESAVASVDAYVLARLRQLASEGLKLALDDFGSGQSSISRLAAMPIHEIKFDQTFTERPAASADFFRAITALGRDRGIRVVAEGIETLEQLVMLRALGIEEMQGDLLGRPMPYEEIGAWHARRASAQQLLFEC